MSARIPSMFARIAGRITLLGSAALIPVTAAAQHFPSDEELTVMLQYLVEDGETPGIVLGILEADGSTRILSYGDAGADAPPLGPKSVFEMGSITKVFTGILLADMVDRGEVSLSDPVSKYVPSGVTVPSRNGREITLLDLATHRSALPRMPANMVRDPSNPEYTVEDLHDFLSQHELRRDIGSEYEYSNIAVALLGHVLARVAGVTYEEALQERVLEPLGMRMSSTVVAGDLRERMTQGHDGRGMVAPYRNWPNLPAMGALRSNVEDMLTFLAANTRTPESRLERVMHTAHEVQASVNSNADIGLLWSVRKIGDRRLITHGGGTAGFSTMIGFDPELRVGFVRLTNTGDFDDDIGADFLRRGPPLAIPEVDVDPEVLRTYVGQYEMAPGRHLVIRMEDDGTMTLQAPGNVRFRLYAESDTEFFVKRTPWRVTFTKDAAGNVDGVMADLEGNERTARKVSGETPAPAVVAGNATLDLPLTPDEMARYEGTYTIEADTMTLELRVFVEDGQLMAQPTGQGASRLLYQGDHELRPAADIDIRVVFTVENGQAEGVSIYDGGDVYAGKRQR